jgi:hypothetical protein
MTVQKVQLIFRSSTLNQARLLIVCVNDAGTIAGWDDAHKLLEFKMCLRDKAVGWFEGLIEDGIDVDNWAMVKAEFLESYKPMYLAKTTCTNFTDLTQKTEESINDYTYCSDVLQASH